MYQFTSLFSQVINYSLSSRATVLKKLRSSGRCSKALSNLTAPTNFKQVQNGLFLFALVSGAKYLWWTWGAATPQW